MMRAAVYARFSSQMQSEASIEDQVRLCQERASREGWTVVQTFADRAISGASLLRSGLQGLIEEAMAGRFDIVLTEALDRLSRDQADIAALFKRLSFAGVRIITLSEGEVSELHVGLKGTMNQLFLKDLAAKTRRGLRGRVEAGRSGGGNSYGYDVIRRLGADGELVTGERTINADEAKVVRRIFEDYAQGVSPRAIATALNAEGVPGPSGSGWSASTLHGNATRGTGVLNNELYLGRRIWNRLRYIKDPSSGRRVSRLNPASEWIVSEVPELRIVEQELWDRAKSRQTATALPKGENRGKALSTANRPRFMFSGMVACGCCGGGMSMISATHLGCSRARNKGTCDNRKTMARGEMERRVLSALSTRLMDPELFAVFCEEFTRETNRLRGLTHSRADERRRDLAKVTRDLDRLVQAIIDGTPARTLQERIATLEARRIELEAVTEETRSAHPPLLHPSMAEVYRMRVTDLARALDRPETRVEAAEILRGLIDAIELRPGAEGYEILLRGDLAGILSLSAGHKKTGSKSGAGFLQVALVAGTGFEPVTFRL